MSVLSARLTCHGVLVPGPTTLAQCSHPPSFRLRGTSLPVTVATDVIDPVLLLDVGLEAVDRGPTRGEPEVITAHVRDTFADHSAIKSHLTSAGSALPTAAGRRCRCPSPINGSGVCRPSAAPG